MFLVQGQRTPLYLGLNTQDIGIKRLSKLSCAGQIALVNAALSTLHANQPYLVVCIY